MAKQKSGHSYIGASSMYRWKACPGSVSLCKGLTSVPSPYAQEGTLAHKLAEAILQGKPEPKKGVTDEMRAAVKVYVDFVEKLWENSQGFLSRIFFEQHVQIASIHPDLFGTADCILYDSDEKLLHVIDYKHGAGIPVDVIENDQLLYYGLGATYFLKGENPNLEIEQIRLTIVQPRCEHTDGPIRSYQISRTQLTDFMIDLSNAVAETLKENAPLVSGGHCRFCPAAAFCPEKQKEANLAAKADFSQVPAGATYDPKKLAHTLSKLDQIEDWVKSVREFALNEARQGRVPPGYKLVESFGHRKWKNEGEVSDFLQSICGLKESDIFESKLKSVAKLEKMLTKHKGVFNDLTERSSKVMLAPEDDPRAAVRIDARADFEVISEKTE